MALLCFPQRSDTEEEKNPVYKIEKEVEDKEEEEKKKLTMYRLNWTLGELLSRLLKDV